MLNQCLFDDQDICNSQQLGVFSFPSNSLMSRSNYGLLCTQNQLMRTLTTTTTTASSYPFDSAAAPPPSSLSQSPNILKDEQEDIFGGPQILSLQRSSGNLWAWGDLTDHSMISSKRNYNGSSSMDHLGISASIKMKKIKGRRKVREPRFCFKTLSDVDVLDDGYKWRKYGQKVVKNTQHPRSYYRCTQDKCRVKKRIERLAEDPRMVITTYEGRHVHSPSNDDNEDDISHSSSHLNTFFCM